MHYHATVCLLVASCPIEFFFVFCLFRVCTHVLIPPVWVLFSFSFLFFSLLIPQISIFETRNVVYNYVIG